MYEKIVTRFQIKDCNYKPTITNLMIYNYYLCFKENMNQPQNLIMNKVLKNSGAFINFAGAREEFLH